MSYRRKAPFALDIDGKTLIDSDKAYEYMYNRILKCPECNQYVKVVRKHDENNLTSWYFAHEKVSNCKGTGASSIHEACKQTIEDNIGKTIIIPAVRSIDTEVHTSSFTTNGKNLRKGSEYLGFDQKYDYDKLPEYWLHHDALFNDKIIMGYREARIIQAIPEYKFSFGMKADEYITVKYEDNDEIQNIAYEIRYSHPKSKQDMETYASHHINVLECNVMMSTPDSTSRMKTRLLGNDNLNNRIPYLEWLYYDENQKP